MTLGPIVSRELCVVARRARSYRQRCSLAIVLLLAIAPMIALIGPLLRGGLSIRELPLFSQSVFISVVSTQILLTIWLVPALVAAAIAEERERRTLASLLVTRLTSAEIVLGKLAAGLVQYTACLAATFPIMILLPLLGGVDPRMVSLAYTGTISTAFFVACLSMVVSTSQRRAARAVGTTIGLATLWCLVPAIFASRWPFLLPQYWLGWVHDANGWVLASSPAKVLQDIVRFGVTTPFFDSIVWMIARQLLLGALLIAWTVVRLRPASRRLEDGDDNAPGRAGTWRGRLRWRLLRRPCGDHPVLWKEMHTSQSLRFAEIVAVLAGVGLVALIGYGTFTFARPAVLEWLASRDAPSTGEMHRTDFNRFLRHVTSWVEFLTLVIAAGLAAGAVAGERARETWDSLIATPLTGREILRDKMIGTVWKVRWGPLLLVALWTVGLFAGSVHPVGFGAAAVLLGVSTWFMVSLGTYISLVSRDSRQASSRTLAPALVLSGSFLACYLPARFATVFSGAGSPSFVNWLALVTPGEIREVMSGDETFRLLGEMRIETYESPSRVLATILIAIAGFAAAAFWLSRAAFHRFDRIVGRPERARDGSVAGVAATSRPWWRKRPAPVVGSILVAIVIGLVVWSDRVARSLREALAETDRLSPGWRLDDVESAREQVPEARNAAVRVMAAGYLLPSSWHGTAGITPEPARKQLDAVRRLSPVLWLPPDGRQSIRAAVEEAGQALAEARALANLPAGRYPVAWTRDGLSTRLPHIASIRQVANLLECDAILQSESGNVDAALTNCRALLNAGRSIGDEPLLVSQRLRMDLRVRACDQVERTLAHGQPSDAAIAALQRSLESEEAEPILVFGIRGERAIMDRFLAAAESGEFTMKQIRGAGFSLTEILMWTNAETRVRHLRFNNRAEQIARLPAEEQQSAFEQLDTDARHLLHASGAPVPPILQAATTCLRSRARLRCTAAALACERYRMRRGAWPSALEDLVPEFASTLPTDPFDGKILRFHRKDGQVVIYSIGENRRDDGGETEALSHATAARDLEFRLWDPKWRSFASKRNGPG